jgi:hypothetical protein
MTSLARATPTAADKARAEAFVRSMDADPAWIEQHWDKLVRQAAVAEMQLRQSTLDTIDELGSLLGAKPIERPAVIDTFVRLPNLDSPIWKTGEAA